MSLSRPRNWAPNFVPNPSKQQRQGDNMFELLLMTLTVLVVYGGVRRGLVEYLEGCDLG
jgi:hypothetical protein